MWWPVDCRDWGVDKNKTRTAYSEKQNGLRVSAESQRDYEVVGGEYWNQHPRSNKRNTKPHGIHREV